MQTFEKLITIIFIFFYISILCVLLKSFYIIILLPIVIVIFTIIQSKLNISKQRTITNKTIFTITLGTTIVYLSLIYSQLLNIHSLTSYTFSIGNFNLYQLFFGYMDGDDTIYAYIPWGEFLSLYHYMPAYTLDTPFYVNNYIPGGYILLGTIYELFGINYGLPLLALIPLLFIIFTEIILISWLYEYNHSKYCWLAIFMLFTTPYFFVLQTEIIRETYIIPFILSAFYCAFLYNKYKTQNYAIYMIFSLALLSFIRETSIIFIISFILGYAWQYGIKEVNQIIKIIKIKTLCVVFLPTVLWYIRNWYYYNNPFYPLFQSFFNNDMIYATTLLTHESNLIDYLINTGYHNNINFLYPSLFLGILFMILNPYRDSFYRFVTITIFTYLLIFFSTTTIYNEPRYYLYIFNATFAMFSTLFIIRIISNFKIYISSKTSKILYILLITLTCSVIFYGLSNAKPTYEDNFYSPMWELDDILLQEKVLLLNSDIIYKNDKYIDLVGVTNTKSISLSLLSYHIYRTNNNNISSILNENNIDTFVFIHYPNESISSEKTITSHAKNSRNFISTINVSIYNYLENHTSVNSTIHLNDSRIITIYDVI